MHAKAALRFLPCESESELWATLQKVTQYKQYAPLHNRLSVFKKKNYWLCLDGKSVNERIDKQLLFDKKLVYIYLFISQVWA